MKVKGNAFNASDRLLNVKEIKIFRKIESQSKFGIFQVIIDLGREGGPSHIGSHPETQREYSSGEL